MAYSTVVLPHRGAYHTRYLPFRVRTNRVSHPVVMSMRKSLAALFIAAQLLSPAAAFARPVSDIVNVSAETVSRIDFLTWSAEVTGLRKSDDCTLSYTRYPKGRKGTLCLAKNSGALEAFGPVTMNYNLNKPISRGEAVDVLTQIIGKRKEADVSAFKDVKTTRQKQAVMNAIALKWMNPVRADAFGWNDLLTGTEASSLLQAAGDAVPLQFTVKVNQGTTTPLPKEELLNAVWQIIQRDYYKKDEVNGDEAAYKAIEGMVSGLNDPYSTFFRPVGASEFSNGIKGEVSGIGAHVEDKGGMVIIVAPLPGSPAERAGLQTGDQILEADGHVLTGIGLDKAVGYIRGEKGTFVELKLLRAGIQISVRVERAIISIPEVQVKWQGDIAIVELLQFGETTERQIRTVFTDVAKKKPKGIILDLRNNPGGLLSAADTVVSNFVPQGSVVAQVKSPSETRNEVTLDGPTVSDTTRVVVLVNKGSASASEIVAGALQDYKRATIVGETTFGKGSVQEVISFSGGEALKLTVANYFTPLGNKVDGIGIKPDIAVTADDRDAQLQRALDILR